MSSIQDLKWRYAVKKFDENKMLSSEQLNTVKEAFNLTATSYGLQPISLVIVQNKALQNELMQHSYAQQQVGQASQVLVICIEREVNSDYIEKYFEHIKNVRELGDEVLTPFKNTLVADFSKKKQQEIQEWATNQAYLAMGNLLTVCAIEKIDACPMEGFIAEEYDRILKLKEKGLAAVLAMPIGFRAADDAFATFKKVRKHMKESIIEIF